MEYIMGNENGIVDSVQNEGDLSGLEADLSAAVAEGKTTNAEADNQNLSGKPDWIDDKFWTGDVAESGAKQHASHMNLQSAYGRMANDLGTQRKLTDRLLDFKRGDDLSQNTPPEHVKVEVEGLLDKPTETLEEFLQPRLDESNAANDARLSQIEQTLRQQAFVSQHPDYNEIGNDPEFSQWIAASPYRARAGQLAVDGDMMAAGELLTEYKLSKGNDQSGETDTTPAGDELQAAREVSLESSANTSTQSTGKVYNRSDLIRLKLEKPHIYEEPRFQEEIMNAYREGRVK